MEFYAKIALQISQRIKMFIANLTYVKEISEIDRFINEHNAFLD